MKSREKFSADNRAADYVTNKILIVFMTSFIAILAAMLYESNVGSGKNVLLIRDIIIPAAMIISVLGIIGGIVIAFFRRKQNKTEELRILSGKNIALYSLAVFAFAFCLKFFDFTIAPRLLYILVPAVTLLYLIFHIYQREFFIHSLVLASTAGVLWLLKVGLTGGRSAKIIPLSIVFIAFILATAAIILYLKRKKGMLAYKNGQTEILPSSTNYMLLFITLAASAIVYVLPLIFGWAMFAHYLVFLVLGYTLILAIYFTTKLM